MTKRFIYQRRRLPVRTYITKILATPVALQAELHLSLNTGRLLSISGCSTTILSLPEEIKGSELLLKTKYGLRIK